MFVIESSDDERPAMPVETDKTESRRDDAAAAKRDRRDRPVEEEADKDIKEGGIEQARREQR